ncbi:MAG: L-lactate permease [Thermodesulfovibrionales bacterium]|jgi:hypothetical protein
MQTNTDRKGTSQYSLPARLHPRDGRVDFRCRKGCGRYLAKALLPSIDDLVNPRLCVHHEFLGSTIPRQRFATTGVLFPFFAAFLDWLGVFMTGSSDTSPNALFGKLKEVSG